MFAADVADGREGEVLVERVIARFGRVDALVNNAGRTQVGPFLEITPQEWDVVVRTDLTAAFHTCRAVLPSMVERGSGTIVNIASRLAQVGIAETAAYSAANAGLVGLTRALAREFGPRGIRVNAVAPGMTVTEMTTALAESEEGRRRLRDMPLGRYGRADEVADAVVFLLTDASSLFLGQTLNPNAGGYMP
jgi:3-oxoacyl-[acyl-carrier protein] reductase